MPAIWNEINAIETLLFAAIALFALFYPQLLEKYRPPKFSFEILSYGNEPGKVQSIRIRTTNIGKGPLPALGSQGPAGEGAGSRDVSLHQEGWRQRIAQPQLCCAKGGCGDIW